MPARVLEDTVRFDGVALESRLDVPLRGIAAAEALVITLERTAMDPEDTLEVGIRLMRAELVRLEG
jgi:hypothetical protein